MKAMYYKLHTKAINNYLDSITVIRVLSLSDETFLATFKTKGKEDLEIIHTAEEILENLALNLWVETDETNYKKGILEWQK